MSPQKKKIVLLCLLLVGSGGWIALASRQSTGQTAQGPPSPSAPPLASPAGQHPSSFLNHPPLSASSGGSLGNGELFFRMMLSVGLILGLGAAAFYLSKRVLPKAAHTSGKEIHVLETAYLGPRKALHLVEVGGRRLLIASTSDRVTMLAPVHETWPDLSQEELGEAQRSGR